MNTTRTIMRWIMAAFFVVAGIGHFVTMDRVVQIVPDFVPTRAPW